MSAILLDGSGENGFTAGDGVDYGCAGRGVYDAFEHTLGKGETLPCSFFQYVYLAGNHFGTKVVHSSLNNFVE